jgi:hypothetical protein
MASETTVSNEEVTNNVNNTTSRKKIKFANFSAVHQDELIMQQQRQIEKEVHKFILPENADLCLISI